MIIWQFICSILRNDSQKLPRRGFNLEVNVQINTIAEKVAVFN
jgi:hypothetical protein